jgi:RHS repeat-associated protein
MAIVDGTSLKTSTILQYQTQYGDSIAFSQKLFENSPLNRVLKQGAPGNDWSVNGDHAIRFEYQTNTAQDTVRYFTVSASWNTSKGLYETPTSLIVSTYDEFQLYKTITKDENWVSGNNNTTEEFKDKEGRVILKRTYNNGVKHDTYYIYDQYGNLTFVLPPEVNSSQTVTNTILDNLCYQYKYDHRNRLVEKKLPGKQWEFIVYDKLDRVVATGPTLSPFTNFTSPNNAGWMITKYDSFNRPIMTAWLQSSTITSAGRKTLQDSQNSATIISESKTTTNTTINGVAFRYTNTAWPTSGYHLLTIDYFDDYTSNLSFSPAITYTAIFGQTLFNNTNGTKPIGLPTLKWVRVPETSTLYKSERSYTMYDLKGRVVRSVTTNYLGGYSRVDSHLQYMTGRVNYTETRTKRIAADTELYVKDTFTYTNQDRLLTHTHKIGTTGTEQLLTRNTYDELGQLLSKQVGGTDVVNYIGLQKVDYRYNIRGWLKSINDVGGLQQQGIPKDLFAFEINYNEVDNETNYTGKPLFNGNIAETYWITSNDDIKRKYGYQYDDLNRLTSAVYQKPNNAIPVTNSYNEILSYDKNGNIKTLQRTGEYDDAVYNLPIDNLTYNYHQDNKNLLLSVDDSTGNQAGFVDVAGQTDYTYDANGNMITDVNKGITAIVYNHLNLPTKITFGTIGTIDYLYNAIGIKLRKIVTQSTSVNTTDYLNGYQYTKTGTTGAVVLDFFPQAEGYVKNTVVNNVNVYSYVFNYTDHLGNVRLSYGLHNNVLTILEENNYYPFGLKHRNYNVTSKQYAQSGGALEIEDCVNCSYKYKYNGKEYQDELGLNVTAMDFRQYDSAIGRFYGIDRMTELVPDMSPYRFAFNNPVYWNDPTGLLEQSGENFEYCPTCPNTPEFKPLIDDPNTEYFYDPVTNQASEVLNEVVINAKESTESDNTSPNGLEILDFFYGFAGDYGKTILERGSYKQTNGKIGNFNDRPFKRLSQNAKAQYSFAKNLKTLKKAGIVTTVILGSIEVSNGAIQDYKTYTATGSTNLKNTAVAGAKVGAGIAVGWMAGAATGALIGTSIPIPLVGTLIGAVVGGVAGYYASEAAGNLVEKAYE